MNKTVFITGGSQGIGKAIVERLANENYYVIVGYKSNKKKAEAIVNKIKKSNSEAIAIYCDLSDRKSIKKVFNEIGNIDILINNAGISQPKKFLDISDKDWSKMLSVNLQGAFICSQEAIPGMIKNKWGRIINIASIGGQWGGVNQVHYASAKAGLIGLTMSLARIYSGSGITSNAISPGIITTEMTSWIKDNNKNSILKDIPIGRFGFPNEIAEVVLFLASNHSSYITGQTINVNGGMLRS
ncbi:3-oxoacyl-ACP reductase family protein [Candidatus Pelagibacter sp. Uisw_090]|uniref:3-oxoacyl-ACP reductase family protein n=1 Tax=Candidatus Pelagibacter sp. Uisw_090 TaxID=3230993 RepID=UPI0039EBCC71